MADGKRRFKKWDDGLENIRRHYPPVEPAPVEAAKAQHLVSTGRLADLAGVSQNTVLRLASSGAIPLPAKEDERGNGLFDLADPKLAAWVEALQKAQGRAS
jgi:hypothetical protein